MPAPAFKLVTACDVVRRPELAAECAFLTNTPPVEGGGASGSGTDEPAGAGAAGTPSESSAGGSAE